MIDITQSDVNAFLIEVAKLGIVGGWSLFIVIFAIGSVKKSSRYERSESRQWLAVMLIITFSLIAIGWYFTLPATRGAQ